MMADFELNYELICFFVETLATCCFFLYVPVFDTLILRYKGPRAL